MLTRSVAVDVKPHACHMHGSNGSITKSLAANIGFLSTFYASPSFLYATESLKNDNLFPFLLLSTFYILVVFFCISTD